MILKNYNYLKKNILVLHNILKKNPYNSVESAFKYDEINNITFSLKGNLVNIFSKVDPQQEAKFILDQYYNLEEKDEIIIFGIGDGSILSELETRVKKSCKIFVIDFLEVFQLLVNYYDIRNICLERVHTFTLLSQKMAFDSFFKSFTVNSNGNSQLIFLPQYLRLFNKKINEFVNKLSEHLEVRRNQILVNKVFEKRWIINSFKNFSKVLDTANFLDLIDYDFSNSAAFIVSAGPSLDFDIEYLKKISEDNKVYIFGVGSANKTLIKHGIKPDGIFTYDPGSFNQNVLKEYIDHEINSPIIFGSSVGYETLEPFNEKFKYHILINQDKLSSILLEDEYSQKKILDSPSIAIITLQTLIKLGFENIFFAGQNLGFYKKRRYSSAINYNAVNEEITEKEMENKIIVDDVYGNQMITNRAYNSMRINFEKYISNCTTVEFINTTKYGANIEGTKYKEIEEVYPSLEKFVKPINLEKYDKSNRYNLKKIEKRLNRLDSERLECIKLIRTLDKEMKFIKKYLKNNDFKSLYGYDKNIEKLLNKLFKNSYFDSLLKLMNRNYYNILINDFSKIKNQKIHEKKYRMIYQKINPLIVLIIRDYNMTIDDFILIKKDLAKKISE